MNKLIKLPNYESVWNMKVQVKFKSQFAILTWCIEIHQLFMKSFFQVISWHMLTHFSKLEALLHVIEKDLLNFLSTLWKVTVHSGKVSQASLFAWLAGVRSVSVTLWTQWSCLTRGSRQTRIPLVGGQMKDTPENSVSNVHIRL